ncbi:esterase FrsA [Rhizobium sp. ERR 922]|uniref:alpha/beta hydrolase family protein n=1 Tax=unclassified Rhizobium TaxID=2613769 RepID=UPI0011A707E5|nr:MULTISPECIES: alpha/beta hydrolase [unclassified Rhizobium]TWB46424.1 esterase FrsA [Rhizobium sp. ERR 922]TWB88791.1 esterase FrsA [Rhizobium sp. ERR 942]
MGKLFTFSLNLFITFCAFTRTTEFFTRFTGVGTFLPKLFRIRFANVLGILPTVFEEQMRECRSFEDRKWTNYWRGKANEHLRTADAILSRMGAPSSDQMLREPTAALHQSLGNALRSVSAVFSDRSPDSIEALRASFAADAERRDAAQALDGLVLAMGYLTIASWPGWTAERLKAYWEAQKLFEVLLFAIAPSVNLIAEKIRIDVPGDVVNAFAVFPEGSGKEPAVLMTNGLEGSIQELLLPTLNYRNMGIAVIAIEMPGTFSYSRPMSLDSEIIYRKVIDRLVEHPRIDKERFGIFGVSFGAYWSTRMAAVDKRLRAVVSNGGPYHRSFSVKTTFGLPEIILSTMSSTLRAKNKLDLGRKLHALSIRHLYKRITQPLLAINGADDTLLSSQDTIDLVREANGTLLLYPGDDHCAMEHYVIWQRHMTAWLEDQLKPPIAT